MKKHTKLIILFVLLTVGVVFSTGTSWAALSTSSSEPVMLVSSADQISEQTAGDAVNPMEEEYREDEIAYNYAGNAVQEETAEIADPLEPFNRAVHQFNDKLYFWALKPVAQGYKAVVPEPARISAKNFFSNLGFPARFLSCLLQADFSGAATETGRFTINTIWGIGGLLDPSSGKKLDLQKQDTDLGQTLGVWGVGQGFYIVWPVFGPSSPRDSVSLVGDYFLYPPSYLSPWYASTGIRAYEEVNATSLRIGDYESLKNAAVDPYVAFRDAYIQYRLKSVKARKARSAPSVGQQSESPAADPALPKKEK
ncbi:MAG: VacJ family lipoprotein [Smithella sp.]|jgi:phospholipid-binding lipoprotein MlaA